MRIETAATLRPFSRTPGSRALLPGTLCQLQAFPTALFFDHLATGQRYRWPLTMRGGVRQFLFTIDLEKGHAVVHGQSSGGHFRLLIFPQQGQLWLKERQAGRERTHKLPLAVAPRAAPPCWRCCFGWHKQQCWEQMVERQQLGELLPFWLRMAQWLPPPAAPLPAGSGNWELLQQCQDLRRKSERLALQGKLQQLFLTAMPQMLLPQRYDTQFWGWSSDPQLEMVFDPQLLQQTAALLQSLFFVCRRPFVELLPCLPPLLRSGRCCHIPLAAGLLHFEWSKQRLRKLIFRAQREGEIGWILPKGIVRCRLRRQLRQRGQILCWPWPLLTFAAGETLYLDRFEK